MEKGDEDKYDHPTQKPIELMRRLILNHLRRAELVYDPFLGSGTTLAAAELNERICYGMELDPKYADVIVARCREIAAIEAELIAGNPDVTGLLLGMQTGMRSFAFFKARNNSNNVVPIGLPMLRVHRRIENLEWLLGVKTEPAHAIRIYSIDMDGQVVPSNRKALDEAVTASDAYR